MDGKLSGATSTLALVETRNALREYGRSGDVPDEVGAIYSLGLTVHELLNVDVRLATEIFQETRVNPYDCTHAAIMKRTGLRNILTAVGVFPYIGRIPYSCTVNRLLSQSLNTGSAILYWPFKGLSIIP